MIVCNNCLQQQSKSESIVVVYSNCYVYSMSYDLSSYTTLVRSIVFNYVRLQYSNRNSITVVIVLYLMCQMIYKSMLVAPVLYSKLYSSHQSRMKRTKEELDNFTEHLLGKLVDVICMLHRMQWRRLKVITSQIRKLLK